MAILPSNIAFNLILALIPLLTIKRRTLLSKTALFFTKAEATSTFPGK